MSTRSLQVKPAYFCDDLLDYILRRLPLKSVIRFILVCKQWQNLITNPTFYQFLQISNKNPGFVIFPRHGWHPNLDYIPFSSTPTMIPQLTKLDFAGERNPMTIMQSCNGLILCSSFGIDTFCYRYYVCNLTTKKFALVPEPDGKDTVWSKVTTMCLVFDPVKSPHYNVIAIMELNKYSLRYFYQIYSYSSETGLWRVSGESFDRENKLEYAKGFVWNGCVHWTNYDEYCSRYLFCFNIESEMVYAKPPLKSKLLEWEKDLYYYYKVSTYIGESCGYLIYAKIMPVVLHIYETKSDYSELCTKHSVRLDEMPIRLGNKRDWQILSVARDEEGHLILILKFSGKVIRYNYVSNTCEDLLDVKDVQISAYQYIVSLSSV